MYKPMKNQYTQEYKQVVVPVVLGTIGMALYYFTDGIFSSSALGDNGISAVAMAWSIVTFVEAIAVGIGTGGAIRYSISSGNKEKANRYFIETVILLTIASVVLTVVALTISKPLFHFLGAEGELFDLTVEYSKVALGGLFIQIFAYGSLPMVRNMGGYKATSIAMEIGYMANFILDYVLMFVFKFGMTGCAWAYLSGQIIIFFPCMWYLYKAYKEIEKPRMNLMDHLETAAMIGRTGIAPAGLYISQNIVSTYIYTRFVLYGGDSALSSYNVIVYTVGISNTFHRAIMEGSQPLISRYYGLRKMDACKHMAKCLLTCFIGLFIICACITIIFQNQFIDMFHVSSIVEGMSHKWLLFYLFGYTCTCVTRTATSFLSAIDRSRAATLITYFEPILMVIAVTVVPMFFKLNGVWYGIVGTYVFVSIISSTISLSNYHRLH